MYAKLKSATSGVVSRGLKTTTKMKNCVHPVTVSNPAWFGASFNKSFLNLFQN